jgi:hypothetical protein
MALHFVRNSVLLLLLLLLLLEHRPVRTLLTGRTGATAQVNQAASGRARFHGWKIQNPPSLFGFLLNENIISVQF